MSQLNIPLICGLLAFIAFAYFIYKSCYTKEEYTRNYQYVDPNYQLQVPLVQQSFDQQQNGYDYARMVDGGELPEVGSLAPHTDSASKRFEKLHSSSVMPKLAQSVTQYDVDVADPKNYFFSARMPHVVLKDRVYQSADPFRGDLAIKQARKGECLIDRSSHGRESMRKSALFNPAYDQMINAYSAAADYPQHVSNEGVIMDM